MIGRNTRFRITSFSPSHCGKMGAPRRSPGSGASPAISSVIRMITSYVRLSYELAQLQTGGTQAEEAQEHGGRDRCHDERVTAATVD